MNKVFKASVFLREFYWDIESASMKVVYRNLDEITFFNVTEEIANSFNKAIFKARFIKTMKSNPAYPYNFAKNRQSK
jgi:hypothetical protein